MHMRGAGAVMTLKKDAKIDEGDLKAALKKNGITFKSFKQETRSKAKAAFVIDVKGLT